MSPRNKSQVATYAEDRSLNFGPLSHAYLSPRDHVIRANLTQPEPPKADGKLFRY